jgi:hypothetical protein
MRVRTMIEAPRFAGVPRFIRDLAFASNITVDLTVDKGWLTESIRLTAEGPQVRVEQFRRSLQKALDAYNG